MGRDFRGAPIAKVCELKIFHDRRLSHRDPRIGSFWSRPREHDDTIHMADLANQSSLSCTKGMTRDCDLRPLWRAVLEES
jgi:hypothetical protein